MQWVLTLHWKTAICCDNTLHFTRNISLCLDIYIYMYINTVYFIQLYICMGVTWSCLACQRELSHSWCCYMIRRFIHPPERTMTKYPPETTELQYVRHKTYFWIYSGLQSRPRLWFIFYCSVLPHLTGLSRDRKMYCIAHEIRINFQIWILTKLRGYQFKVRDIIADRQW